MKTTINLHVEIECEDDSVDKGLVADVICAAVGKKFKKVEEVWVYKAEPFPVRSLLSGHKKKDTRLRFGGIKKKKKA